VAGGLAARGLQPGEVFAIYCPNLPEYAVAFYAVQLAGGVNTTINPLYTVDELAAQLHDAGASYLLTIPAFLDKALQGAAKSGVREVFVLGEAGGATPFAELLRARRQPPEVAIDPRGDLAVLPYSTGTTGLPKGVMLTHHNLVANLCQCQGVWGGTAEDEVVIAVLPFFHIYGQIVLMAFSLWQGATLVMMPRFDLEQFLTILQDYRVTRAFLGAADRAGAGQAPAGRPVRPVGAAVHQLGRRAAWRRARGGVQQAARLPGLPGLRAHRDQPGADHSPARAGQDPARLGWAAVAQHRGAGR
jgi:acyl-CoA synthetase (AMP-forming)/AMP-acid ligase II